MKDFFISYNHKDASYAKWIAEELENAQYTTIIQDWDFKPGNNFVLEMQNAMTSGERTIAVLSNNYLSSLFTQTEWAYAFASDPTGKERRLIPVKISDCELPGIFKTIIVCNLVGLDEDEAARILLEDISGIRKTGSVVFPNNIAGNNMPLIKELLDLLETSKTTFFAQRELRNELYLNVKKRLAITQRMQIEDFFPQYYKDFLPAELRIHKIIRGYTKNILHDYNERVLNLLNANPELSNKLNRLTDLKNHLIVWKTKYDSVFLDDESMNLIYVGVKEKVPFPVGIEEDLKTLMK